MSSIFAYDHAFQTDTVLLCCPCYSLLPSAHKPYVALLACQKSPLQELVADQIEAMTQRCHPAGAAPQHPGGAAHAPAAHHPDALLQKAVHRDHFEGPVLRNPQGGSLVHKLARLPSWITRYS
jgi:hypothetical protein